MRFLVFLAALACGFHLSAQAEMSQPGDCPAASMGEKQVYWGDLHVHTAKSLDAFGFGTLAGPKQAYSFAKGGEIDMFGHRVRLERPLDFVAVTDHAEWLDIMHICTVPEHADDPYCAALQVDTGSPAVGGKIFGDFVIPTITKEEPETPSICVENPARCQKAMLDSWADTQAIANAANDPCNFTAFIGYEWSATPNFSHTHRNIVFASDSVTKDAIDYIRYPKVSQLWEQLGRQCKPEDGCDVIAIPHNTNMGDGTSFDVETEDERELQLRAKYERLAEIHQGKGNSECLPAFGEPETDDCNFELYLTHHSRPTPREDFDEESWEKMRSTYVRGLLLKGLKAYEKNPSGGNPLQLGIVGSTDTHTAMPGRVEDESWQGSVFGFGDFDTMMSRPGFNPGGIVAVWARENTRASIFAALKRREVYGSSGPRITVRFDASTDGKTLSCEAAKVPESSLPMGAEFEHADQAPSFMIEATADQEPLGSLEIIKGEYVDGDIKQSVTRVWSRPEDGDGETACAVWTDENYNADSPAFWYARVQQEPTKRWSKVQCETEGRCDEFPEADKMIRERAWASPIWHLPIAANVEETTAD